MLLIHRLVCATAFALYTASTWVTAGIVQTGVRVFAGDHPSGIPYIVSTDDSLACCLTTAASTATAVAGNSTATSLAQADSLKETLKQKISASVAASQFVVGRHSGGSSLAKMQGSINLIGLVPGLATFTGVLDGTYNFGQHADNFLFISYSFSVGNSPNGAGSPFVVSQFIGCCGAVTFSTPFTWTQPVNPGDRINFDLFFYTTLYAVAGSVDFDATNTFKITGIGLPLGYSFTSDSTGFLSQFGAPTVPVDPGTPLVGQVPEPGTLMLIGLAGMLAVATRRPGSAKHGAGRAQHFQPFRPTLSPDRFA